MNQKSFLIAISVIFLLGISLGVLRFREPLANFIIQLIPRPEFTPKPAELVLSEQELADMVKPSVVRIVQHVTGNVEIAPFDFDFKTRSVFSVPGERVSIPIDEYVAGSGFVVHPNGHILTNAHVVSRETMKVYLVGQVVLLAFFDKASKLNQEELQRLKTEEAAMQEFSDKIFEYVLRESKSDIQNKVVVLNPSSKAMQLKDLFSEGFEAEVVDVNDNFVWDNRDVGLIRINALKLPALRLGSSDILTTGKRIYVFGFPATAEFNRKNPLEATFTQGVISALKDSEQRDFKIYQTDAKVSQGSSGGPLFDERGEPIGIVTFGTSEEIRAAGDVFAFAIPIKLANEVLLNRLVFNEAGNYAEYFQKGLAWARGRRCKKALEEFELARNTNDRFNVGQYLKPYEEQCRALMAERKSIDTAEAELREWLKGFGSFMWWVITIGTIVVGGFAAAIFFMWKRMKKEEEEMHELQIMVEKKQKLQAQQSEQSEKQSASGEEIKK